MKLKKKIVGVKYADLALPSVFQEVNRMKKQAFFIKQPRA